MQHRRCEDSSLDYYTRRVIIDTDPGIDDALALLLAFGSPQEITVEGLTIVPGNGKSTQQVRNTTLATNSQQRRRTYLLSVY